MADLVAGLNSQPNTDRMDARVFELSCPHCGAALEVHEDQPEQFACGYCGAAVLIQRRGGTVALREIAAGIERVRESSDKTAAELALQRYQADFAALRPQIEAQAKLVSSKRFQLVGCAPAMLVFGLLLLGAGSSALFFALVVLVLGLAVGGAAYLKSSDLRRSLEELEQQARDLNGRMAEKKRIADG